MESVLAFDVVGGRGFYHPEGLASMGQLADMVTAAVRLARADGLQDMVIDLTHVRGFESPGPAYRRWVVRRWAQASERALRVAVVARREYISPHKIGLLVAAEEGLQAHICESEGEAVAWLDALGAKAPEAGAVPFALVGTPELHR